MRRTLVAIAVIVVLAVAVFFVAAIRPRPNDLPSPLPKPTDLVPTLSPGSLEGFVEVRCNRSAGRDDDYFELDGKCYQRATPAPTPSASG